MIPERQVSRSVLLDWNESPLGPSPTAILRVAEGARQLHRYPRGLREEVCSLVADYFRANPGEVLLTAGVDEAVDLFLSLGDHAYAVSPGFDGFIERSRARRVPMTAIPLGDDWQPTALPPSLTAGSLGILAQPNNPTGNVFGAHWIEKFRSRVEYLLLDCTYAEFSEQRPTPWTSRLHNVLFFRSFSKAFGLAGIRAGCLIGDASLISALADSQRFHSVDSISLHAIAGTLDDPAHLGLVVSYVRSARQELADILSSSGLFSSVRGTDANFVLARPRTGDSRACAEILARLGVRVRPCDACGLTDWIRVSVGSPDDHAILRKVLADLEQIHPSQQSCAPGATLDK